MGPPRPQGGPREKGSRGKGAQHPVCFCFLLGCVPAFGGALRECFPRMVAFSWSLLVAPRRRAKATDHPKCLILPTGPRGPAKDLSPTVMCAPAPKATSGRNLGPRYTRNVDMFAGATNKVLRAEKKHRWVESSGLLYCFGAISKLKSSSSATVVFIVVPARLILVSRGATVVL